MRCLWRSQNILNQNLQKSSQVAKLAKLLNNYRKSSYTALYAGHLNTYPEAFLESFQMGARWRTTDNFEVQNQNQKLEQIFFFFFYYSTVLDFQSTKINLGFKKKKKSVYELESTRLAGFHICPLNWEQLEKTMCRITKLKSIHLAEI